MSQDSQIIHTVLQNWRTTVERTGKAFNALSDEALQQPVSPGRNRAYYLLGHLTAVHDLLLPLLRLGDRLYPALDEEFLSKPDGTFADRPARPAELRAAWAEVNARLQAKLNTLTPEQWLERHAAVSEEDFAKEPHRNRLTVLLGRAGHASYHLGQVKLVS